MKHIKDIFARYSSDESGATAIEYGLIAALIGVAIIAGASAMGGGINSLFGDVDSEIGKTL